MARYCGDCIHAGICKFEDIQNYILNTTKQNLEDFPEVKDIFEIQLTCAKKESKPVVEDFNPGYQTAQVFISN